VREESRKRFKAALALLEAGESEALIFTKVDRASRCTEEPNAAPEPRILLDLVSNTRVFRASRPQYARSARACARTRPRVQLVNPFPRRLLTDEEI
jgi:hypothetical protein